MGRSVAELRKAVGGSFLCVCGAVYFAQGFRSLASLSMQLHLKEMGLSPAVAQSVLTTSALPWSIKPIYGLVSDFVPIGGRRRQPYILIAGVVGLLAWVGLSAITARDAQAPPPPPPGDAEDDAAAAAAAAAVAASSGWLLMMAMLLSNLSTAVSDVVVDAMVAEKSGGSDALEDDLQAFCWNALFVGGALGSAVGAVAMTTLGVPGVFLATSICPLIVAVAALSLNEPVAVVDTSGTSAARRTVADEVRSTVTAACNPAVLVPLLYIFIDGAVAPGLGTVTYFYVTTELGFSNEYLSAMGSAMWGVMLCGSLLGAAVFIPGQSSYREFMWWGGVVKIVMSLSTLVLALRLNIACGVSDEVYVGVSDAIETAVGRVLMLPFLSLAAKLTALNPGCEATLFALFMSVYNLSNTAGSYWGAAVCAYLGLEDGSFEALPTALLFRSVCMLLPLTLTYRMIPDTVATRKTAVDASTKAKSE